MDTFFHPGEGWAHCALVVIFGASGLLDPAVDVFAGVAAGIRHSCSPSS
jgi:hypothetical protein